MTATLRSASAPRLGSSNSLELLPRLGSIRARSWRDRAKAGGCDGKIRDRRSAPSAHPLRVVPPRVAELALQLSLLAVHAEIHQRKVRDRQGERRRRSEQQACAEEDEHVSTKKGRT